MPRFSDIVTRAPRSRRSRAEAELLCRIPLPVSSDAALAPAREAVLACFPPSHPCYPIGRGRLIEYGGATFALESLPLPSAAFGATVYPGPVAARACVVRALVTAISAADQKHADV